MRTVGKGGVRHTCDIHNLNTSREQLEKGVFATPTTSTIWRHHENKIRGLRMLTTHETLISWTWRWLVSTFRPKDDQPNQNVYILNAFWTHNKTAQFSPHPGHEHLDYIMRTKSDMRIDVRNHGLKTARLLKWYKLCTLKPSARGLHTFPSLDSLVFTHFPLLVACSSHISLSW